jgi:predicted alpha/beta-fold hydrolase
MIAPFNPADGDENPRSAPIPLFQPHPWLKGKHAQTIVARYWGGASDVLPAAPHELELPDGDRLLLLESTPTACAETRPAAVLVHGLAGDADAAYMVRIGRRLLNHGIRVIRLNLRGAGAGFGLARRIYHAGRSDDLREVLRWLAPRQGGAPIALIGFSLGANLVLKLAAEAADAPIPGLDCVIAANPPIDLAACASQLQKSANRLYDVNFARWLRAMVKRLHARFPELGDLDLSGVWSVYEFDDRYTSRRNGFVSADDYYARCSLTDALARIPIAGLIVHARDDPFVPFEAVLRAQRPAHLALEVVPAGGHLGYVSRDRWRGNRRWLDSRLEVWLGSRWGLAPLNERACM